MRGVLALLAELLEIDDVGQLGAHDGSSSFITDIRPP
jgi:hypothetical protein